MNKILEAWLNERAEIYKSNLDSRGQTASGKSKRETRVVETEGGGGIQVPLYNRALVYGRVPSSNGSAPGSLKALIRQWIDDKGITPTDNISKDSLAFLITRKIHRDGVKVPNQYNDGNLFNETITKESTQKLVKDLGVFYLTEFKSGISDIWQQSR